MSEQADRHYHPHHFLALVQFNDIVLPAESIGDDEIEDLAGIDALKLQHQHVQRYSQPNTTATTETRAIHLANGPGTLVEFDAGSIVACLTTATITVDIKKNGVSVLTSVLTLNNANTARVAVPATISGGS